MKQVWLKDILAYLRGSTKGQKTYSQLCWLARLILVIPSTNAASERSFSVMKQLNTYLRSTMTDLARYNCSCTGICSRKLLFHNCNYGEGPQTPLLNGCTLCSQIVCPTNLNLLPTPLDTSIDLSNSAVFVWLSLHPLTVP